MGSRCLVRRGHEEVVLCCVQANFIKGDGDRRFLESTAFEPLHD